MKKVVSYFLVLVMVLSLGACGKKEAAESTGSAPAVSEPMEADAQADTESEGEGFGAVEVDEGIFNVTLTIPAEFAEGMTQEEIDAAVNEGTYKSATLNEDGSVTIVMSKGQHDDLMKTTADSIEESLQSMVGSEDYPNIVSIEHNEDFTEFTVTTKSESLDLAESFSVLMFYMSGGMYNAFAGNSVDNVHVQFVNEASGAVIEDANSRDMEG